MSAAPFDTHEVVKELKASGFTDAQAEALTRVVRDVHNTGMANLATKTDLAVFATRSDLAETKADILKWMVSTIGIQTVVIIGAVVALVRMGH
ncbi:coiled-coil domain-containing protein [Rhodopila sp.]|uniref:coiled-coil domain-containing protein n=1 Tax=Rhodopila sp. TaxID=2480087 RepID=UPI003D1126B9